MNAAVTHKLLDSLATNAGQNRDEGGSQGASALHSALHRGCQLTDKERVHDNRVNRIDERQRNDTWGYEHRPRWGCCRVDQLRRDLLVGEAAGDTPASQYFLRYLSMMWRGMDIWILVATPAR